MKLGIHPAHEWWLYNTSAGRRLLARVVPASALPPATRELICEEQGHVALGDGTCQRCGAKVPQRGARR